MVFRGSPPRDAHLAARRSSESERLVNFCAFARRRPRVKSIAGSLPAIRTGCCASSIAAFRLPSSPQQVAKSIEPDSGLGTFLERKKKQFSHASVAIETRPSNRLKQNEICGLCVDSDVLSPSWLGVENSFPCENLSSEILCPRLVIMRFLPERYSSSV